MTVAAVFFAVVALVIVGGLAYGAGHANGARAGYDVGRSEACEREVGAALRVERTHRSVSVCVPPPLDWAAMERGRR